MAAYDWKPFLEQWSRDILASGEVEHLDLPEDVIESGWLGFPGATEEQIAAAEARLGTVFPPSYRAFLQVTNGWRTLGFFIDTIWPVEQVEWFRTRHQDWIDGWNEGAALFGGDVPPVTDDDYFVYGDEQDSVNMRAEYLKTALEISDEGDSAILLLNPEVVTPEGEWEAWFFASWLPGADRYRSFWDLLQARYATFRHLVQHEAKRLQSIDPPETIAAKLPGLIAEIDEKARGYEEIAAAHQNRDMGHAAGTAQALRSVADAVRQLAHEADDPAQLPARLAALAGEFEQKAGALVADFMQSDTVGLVQGFEQQIKEDNELQQWMAQLGQAPQRGEMPPELRQKAEGMLMDLIQQMMPHFGQIQKGLGASGESEGYRQGAATIRWFLNR